MTPFPSEASEAPEWRWPIFQVPVHALRGGELHAVTRQLELTARRNGRCAVTALSVALTRLADAGGVLSLTLPAAPVGARSPFLVTAGPLPQAGADAWGVLDYQGTPLALGRSAYEIATWLATAAEHGVRVDSVSGRAPVASMPPAGAAVPKRWLSTDLWLQAFRQVRPRFLALLRSRGGM